MHRPASSMDRVRRVALIGLLALAACGRDRDKAFVDAAALTGGDAYAGREKAREYGCGSCHTIPGVPGAHALVGPPLEGIAGRMYIAGVLTNTPQHMMRWIMDPPAVDSATAMPNVGVTEKDARDIAAYLYTLTSGREPPR
ncbi:c-type cytochrome [Longimicrobium sp.]|uniref:c-type cytochrome n=1 Tax=Longimicrobium sp. TaxID=2029185 RepID=UPI003B3B5207